MLLPDVNVLLHTYRPNASREAAAVADWLTPRLVGVERVALSADVLAAVVRIATHPRVFSTPSTPSDAVSFTASVIAAPATTMVRPGPDHWSLFASLVAQLKLRSNDVPDAYLAASVIEAGATLVTRDRGFRRFPGLRVVDPLDDPA
ncbi:MAG: TA system VapC family ribonuclease toxin [Phycicoccus sp.]